MTRKVLQHLPGSCPVDPVGVRFADAPGGCISNHSRPRPWKVKNVAGCELQPSPGVAVVGTGEGSPRPAPDSSLDSFNYKSAKVVFKGDRYHPLQFRDFVFERVNASVRVRGIGPDGAAYRAVIPCTYRWSPHMRKRNLAVIYSFVDYVTERGYDASEVAFLTLTVRHPSRHTYRAASQCVDDLRRGWSLLSREFRRYDLEYLCVMEPGSENGFAHYHLAVLGASEAVCERLIDRWCSITGALPVGQDYSLVKDIRNTGAYIAKYLSKTLDSELDYRWLELCYRKRIRTWSMSREARKYIAEKYRNPLQGLGVFGDSCMSWALAPDDGVTLRE
jgi:hypothetical protein